MCVDDIFPGESYVVVFFSNEGVVLIALIGFLNDCHCQAGYDRLNVLPPPVAEHIRGLFSNFLFYTGPCNR